MPRTYEPIEKVTLVSNASDVTFSSIPGTYTDLIVVLNPKGSTTNYTRVQFNGDTGTNYSFTDLTGNGSSAVSSRTSNNAFMYWQAVSINSSTDLSQISIAQIMNYSNTTTNKTVIARANEAGSATETVVALWRSTAAITSIKLYPNTGTFVSGSNFALFGIKAA